MRRPSSHDSISVDKLYDSLSFVSTLLALMGRFEPELHGLSEAASAAFRRNFRFGWPEVLRTASNVSADCDATK